MKHFIISILILFTSGHTIAQDITGSWMGSLPAGGSSIRLIFNISKNADGSLKSTFDSPDQKAFGIACSNTVLVKDSLAIELAIIGGSYKGKWDGKDQISGIYRQNNGQIGLTLKRTVAGDNADLKKDLIRPQTPKPPFNYLSEDVEYDNADKSVHYGATFTRPNGDGKYPAVIIISGSGTQDRDGTILGHKLYWVLADYLTKNGIAVLRVDDRGAGKSTLGNDIKDATSRTFSYDVETSLNYLLTRNDVDKKHIGLIGHSEGGIIAPMVAARRKDVSFIVLWGAPEIGGLKINTAQNALALKNAGLDETKIQAFSDLHSKILSLFASSPNVTTLNSGITTAFNTWKKAQTPETLTALNANIEAPALFPQYDKLYNLAWMRYFISYDPASDLRKVKCPVLAINGEKDTQVDAASNLELIKEVLAENGNKNFEVKALPGLNHLLQTAQTGDATEYEKIEETISPGAMKIISDWIKMQTK